MISSFGRGTALFKGGLRSNPRAILCLRIVPRSSSRVYLSSMPAGRYHLRFDVQWEDPKQPAEVEVRLVQGVAHLFPLG